MSETLVENLTNGGLNALRLIADEVLPREGWLERGAFIQTDEGNRLRRALIGLGSGKTKLEVIVSVSNLAWGSQEPFCELDSSIHSSEWPGAVVTFNPYVGAARFMLGALDLDINVTQTAARIASEHH
jgi:hypothetical protein